MCAHVVIRHVDEGALEVGGGGDGALQAEYRGNR